ncbi:MAG: RsmB/NOP family class I SAM-dependent RNA methyltransferase [Candidatus Hermodarchaeota archaeon]
MTFQFENLINLLSSFVEGKSGIIDDINRRDSIVFHYYNEIVRYWNRLNFILKKIISKSQKVNSGKISKYLYIIFRYYEEGASFNDIIRDIGVDELDKDDLIFIEKLEHFSYKKALMIKSTIENLSLNYAYPTFLIKLLKPFMRKEFLRVNLIQMNRYNPLEDNFTFFINNLKVENQDEINQFLKTLEGNNVQINNDEYHPQLYFMPLKHKKQLILSEWYRSGKVIIVDKASVIVATLLNPIKNELISDLCAAPGIKTFILANLTNNASKIIASDFSYTRTKQMAFLFRNLSVSSTLILNSDGITPPIRTNIRFDRILIDAPCTGSGTLLSNPELKWRQNSNFLKQNMVLQTKLLNSAINFLKPGGVLLYSTCSLYAEEGELQILKFFDQLKPVELPKWISPSYKIDGRGIPGTGRLFPSIHHTKGFFIGKFKKKE